MSTQNNISHFTELPSGKTVQGKKISAFASNNDQNKNWIYLMAGVHGDEIEGVYVLEQVFSWIKENKSSSSSLAAIPLIVIPCLNLDGYQARTRLNANQVDLNRNFPTNDWSPAFSDPSNNPGVSPLSEPENKFLVGLLDTYKPEFIISLHSWKPVLNYNGKCQRRAEYIAEFNHYPVEGDIGYPTPGSFGTYGPTHYNAPILTYELPRVDVTGKTLPEIWEENKKGLQSLLTHPNILFDRSY